jgi:hypothetical protein
MAEVAARGHSDTQIITMKKKLFIALYTVGIVIVIAVLAGVVTTINRRPADPLSPEEKADTSLAQYAERPNSTTTYGTSNIPFFLTPYIFPQAEPLSEGCSLRFAFDPVKKAVEPGGLISYNITLSNQGKETCRNASLSVYYTNQEQYVSSDPKPSASDYYWGFGDVAPARSVGLSLTTKNSSVSGRDIVSEACATAENYSDVCAQTVIFVQTGASKTDSLTNVVTNTINKIKAPTVGGVWGKQFSQKEFGIWVWDSPKKMTAAYAEKVISTSQQNGFNVIYVTIDDYLPISQIGSQSEKDKQTKSYMQALSVFVQSARQAGIQVDAVAGAKDWSKPENRWKGYAVIDFVKQYNETYPNAAVRNFQYDVEPYLLADYDNNKASVLKDYIEFIDESARRMKEVPAGFSVVIPHFYDKEQKWTPAFTYNGSDAYAYTHLLRVLAQKNNTEVIIMAYRNFFNNQNGTRQISEEEIKESSSGYGTKVIIAQETGDVPPAYVTFHDYPKVSLYDALSDIQSHFGSYKNYGGTAVHYLDSFLKLE